MTTFPVVAASSVCVLMLAVGPAAQQQQQQQQQRTGVISGRVVTDEARPQPVRKATVRLGASETYGGRFVVTGDDGSFSFGELPAGRYTLTAARPGYITSAFGARRPEGPGAAVGLSDGQRMTNLTMRMLRGGAITGTIRDQNGVVAQGVPVNVLAIRRNPQTGERSLQRVGINTRGVTNDLGMYRTFALPPGDYVVVSYGPAETTLDLRQTTAADVQWVTQLTQSPGQGGAPPAAARTLTYTPIYYPGTVAVDQATKVTLGAGEERVGVDIKHVLVPSVTVSGIVTSPEGPAAGVMVSAIARPAEGMQVLGNTRTTTTGADGRFALTGLAPGPYTITARAQPAGGGRGGAVPTADAAAAAAAARAESLAGARVEVLAGRGLATTPTTLFAASPVTLDQDIEVALHLQQGARLTGRATFGGPGVPPAPNPGVVRVTAQPAPAQPGVVPIVGAALDPAGNFSIAGLAPGRYRLTVTVVGPQTQAWVVRSALVGGVDTLDTPIEIGAAETREIALTFTDRLAELSGTVQDAAGRPASDYFIIVCSADPAFWSPGSRRVQAKRPGTDGRFILPNLPPGDYLVAAVSDVEPGEWYDPEFLTQMKAAAIRITLGERESKVQSIRLAQ